MNVNPQILTGKTCPYCHCKSELVDSSAVYGRSYGLIYLCKPCDAFVGTHKDSDIALGRLANPRLRTAKKEAHFWFDQIARTSLINKIKPEYIPGVTNRSKAYLWLAEQMKMDIQYCHIGMFDVDECHRAIVISKAAINSVKTTS